MKHWLGLSEPILPTFAADGRKLSARCPKCEGKTEFQVCPHCHHRLPVHFAKSRSRMIALLGAKESGKTVYMTVLIHELMHRMGRELDVAVQGCDEDTLRTYYRDYEARLYSDHHLFETTKPAPTPRKPLVFRLTSKKTGLLGNRTVHTILSFFDTAGEDLQSEYGVERNVRYLDNAHGIILLIDPLQMPGARGQAHPEAVLPQQGQAELDRPTSVLTRVIEQLMRRRGKAGHQISQPVAVAFTKLDAVDHLIKDGTPLSPDHRVTSSRPDEDDSRAVHEQVRGLLEDWEGPQLDQQMSTMFRRYRYFGLSALGDVPDSPNTVSGVRPYRVGDPLIWLLREFGTMPATKG